MNFDFSLLGFHAGYFSTYSPQTLDELIQKALIPALSSYHLIGVYLPKIIKRVDSWRIVQSYMAESINKPTIVDLCLPFHDQKFKKTYLGRYIIFQGNLLGIRLNTNPLHFMEMSSWPRHKIELMKLPNQIKNCNNLSEILIGQFSLRLNNISIGLLFQEELKTSVIQYCRHRFEMISLVHESLIDGSTMNKKSQILKSSFVLEAKMGGSDLLLSNASIKQLFQVEGNLKSWRNRIIYLDYYDFNKIIKNKKYYEISNPKNQEKSTISELDINLSICKQQQPARLKEIILKESDMQNGVVISSQSESGSDPAQDTDIQLNAYLKRLQKIFTFASCGKIILDLEQSPLTICFLYVFEQFATHLMHSEDQQGLDPSLNQMTPSPEKITPQNMILLELIDRAHHGINCMVQKMNISHLININFFSCGEAKSSFTCAENSSNIGNCLALFEEMLGTNFRSQPFVPVISSSLHLANVAQVINFKSNVAFTTNQFQNYNNLDAFSHSEKSLEIISYLDTKAETNLQTIILTSIFSGDQLKRLYFSQQLKNMIGDEQYHELVWSKHEELEMKKKKVSEKVNGLGIDEMIDVDLEEIKLDELIETKRIQHLIQENNFLLFQFKQYYQKIVQFHTNISKAEIFPHFLMRKISQIEFHKSPQTNNLASELLVVQAQSMYEIFCLLTANNNGFSMATQIGNKLQIQTIKDLQMEEASKLKCHCCLFHYPPFLVYRCKQNLCREAFCLKCLVEDYSMQGHQLKDKKTNRKKKLRLCPVCKNECPKHCKSCQLKRQIKIKLNINQTPKKRDDKCHYCYESNYINFFCSNSKCSKIFCMKCCTANHFQDLQQSYKTYNWICYACHGNCCCNPCENQKKLIEKQIELENYQNEMLNNQMKESQNHGIIQEIENMFEVEQLNIIQKMGRSGNEDVEQKSVDRDNVKIELNKSFISNLKHEHEVEMKVISGSEIPPQFSKNCGLNQEGNQVLWKNHQPLSTNPNRSQHQLINLDGSQDSNLPTKHPIFYQPTFQNYNHSQEAKQKPKYSQDFETQKSTRRGNVQDKAKRFNPLNWKKQQNEMTKERTIMNQGLLVGEMNPINFLTFDY